MISPHHITQAVERAQQALNVAEHKPSPKFDPGGGSASTAQEGAPTPTPVGIISAKRELRDMLLDWVGLVSEGMQVVAHCDPTEPDMLHWLGTGERAQYLAAHEAGQDFLDELTTVTKSLESPYMPRPTRTFLGVHAGEEIHIREGQDLVELADGTVERVESIRAWNRDQVRMAEGTAKEVAEMIWEFFGEYIKPRLIADTRNNDANPKVKREPKLTSVRKDGRDHIYRVQDVLDRLVHKNNSEKS